MPSILDPYAVLALPPDASSEQIKIQFRRLAKDHHPDRHHGSSEAAAQLHLIVQAYRTLSDPCAREHHALYQPYTSSSWVEEQRTRDLNTLDITLRTICRSFSSLDDFLEAYALQQRMDILPPTHGQDGIPAASEKFSLFRKLYSLAERNRMSVSDLKKYLTKYAEAVSLARRHGVGIQAHLQARFSNGH